MRIAFVSGNRELLPDAVTPLGLLYVMESTPERHEKHLVDLCFEQDPIEALRKRLSALQPDLVALSMRNIGSRAAQRKTTLPIHKTSRDSPT